ncbi:MAG: hypothetical protein E6H78_16240 [Betaproteobacteria bacterium]|nr:MAG: hypothetical protein E6H78_16240 [Betaproteobacteria bacterium]
MSKLFSRVYLATEAIVICFPLTVLFLVRVLPAQIDHAVSFPEFAFMDLVSGLGTLAALLCLWRLMAAFLVRGRTGLRRLSTYWWVLPVAGAALAVHMAAGSWSARSRSDPGSTNLCGSCRCSSRCCICALSAG